MSEPINIPLEALQTPEDKRDSDPANAKFTVMYEGKLLPVARMFGMDGQRVFNPLHAVLCVAWRSGKWMMIQCHQGEVSPKRDPHEYLHTMKGKQ